MGISHILMMGVVFLCLGLWWWFKQGRHGARVQHVYLGLQDQEEIQYTFNGFFKLDFGAKDVGLAFVGVSRTPKALTLTVTDGDTLVFRVHEEEPRRYRPGQFQLTCVKEKDGKRVGTTGYQEPASVYQVDTHDTEPFNISIARSAADVINNWNESAA